MSQAAKTARQEQAQEQLQQQAEQLMQQMVQPPLAELQRRLRDALTEGVVHDKHISYKPKDWKNKPKKNETPKTHPHLWIKFMTHSHRKGYMDFLVGKWDYKIDPPIVGGDRIYIVGHLTIYGCDGMLTRSAIGTETLKTSSFGDPSSNADAMAFGRCCMAFGFLREWWSE